MGIVKGTFVRAAFRAGLGLCTGVVLSLGATPAAAEWRVYMSGEIGYSSAETDVDGQLVTVGPVFRSISGDDDDVSPFVGGAIGIAVPMNELAPLEMPRGFRLPDWDMRLEVEAVGLREYDFRTPSIVASIESPVITDVETWSLMSNFWLDVPLSGLYKPISWTSSRLFGRWRLRGLKHVLDRTTVNMGAGVGVAYLDADTRWSDNRGEDDAYNFAWQAGVGLGYQVSERVNLGVGYRYIDVGDLDYDFGGGAGLDTAFPSNVEIDPEIHEARVTIRVEVWDFTMPWQ